MTTWLAIICRSPSSIWTVVYGPNKPNLNVEFFTPIFSGNLFEQLLHRGVTLGRVGLAHQLPFFLLFILCPSTRRSRWGESEEGGGDDGGKAGAVQAVARGIAAAVSDNVLAPMAAVTMDQVRIQGFGGLVHRRWLRGGRGWLRGPTMRRGGAASAMDGAQVVGRAGGA
jgi:hypothetical protein